ncbi:MAG TPA: class I tRNA ligase family protein, partial [Candidatus Nanoarchaeia archaeon]|nr:class I tRNA ligase family protein [Candidatus Nanoarchaeia archaeon]
MAKKRNVIVCTAWPYIHGLPHLGNFLQILSGCVLKRYYTHTGANVIHVSGSDVHGARMEFQAHKEGISPKELVTRNHEKMLGLLKSYNIDFTNYT